MRNDITGYQEKGQFIKSKISIFLIFSLATAFIGFVLSSCFDSPGMFKPGDTVEPFSFVNSNRDTVALKGGQFHFIFFSNDLPGDAGIVKYIQNISSAHFQGKGFDFYMIGQGRGSNLTLQREFAGSPFRFLPYQQNTKILGRFIDPPNTRHALIVITPGMVLDSVYYFFKEDDIRQLLEKYLLGHITYGDRANDKKLSLGDPFPVFSITGLNTEESGKVTDITRYRLYAWIVFGSNCMSCALENHLGKYREIEDRLTQKLPMPIGLIFSRYFSGSEILEKIEAYKIKTTTFLAEEALLGIEDDYYRNPANSDSIMVFITGKDNRIRYMANFQDFVRAFEEGHFEENISSQD